MRAVDKWTHSFVKNDVCSYVIKGPNEMQSYDKLYVKIDKITNCKVYIAKGKRYRWMDHLDKDNVKNKDVFDTRGSWEFYVVGISDSVFKGTFRMRVWVEQAQKPEPKQVVYNPPNMIKQPTQPPNT